MVPHPLLMFSFLLRGLSKRRLYKKKKIKSSPKRKSLWKGKREMLEIARTKLTSIHHRAIVRMWHFWRRPAMEKDSQIRCGFYAREESCSLQLTIS